MFLLGIGIAAVSPIIAIGFYTLVALVLLSRRNIEYFFALFYLILLFSDSRSQIFEFAVNTKTFLALMLPIGILITRSLNLNPIYKFFIPFLSIAFIALLDSVTPLIGFQKTVSYSFIILAVPALFIYLLREKGSVYLKSFLYLLAAILVLGLVFRLINPEFTSLSGRFRGLLGNPNGLGIFLILVFLLYQVSINRYPDLFSKRERNILAVVFVINLLLCQSRTAILVFILFFLLRWLFQRSYAAGVVTIILLIGALNYISLDLINVITSLGLEEFLRADTLETGSGRIVAWNFAWERIQENFFLGRGFAHSEHLYNVQYEKLLNDLGHQGNVHNSYLTFWLDVGLLGLLAFAIPFISLFFRSAAESSIALPVFFCLAFSANFESWMAASLNPLTSLFLITLSLLLVKAKVEEEPESIEET